MKKKIYVSTVAILIVVIITGIITNYIDSGRVTTGHEPKCCLKVISKDGSKVTYWGLGYKVVRYVGVSPNEPYKNNIGVKMGNWFMNYNLPEENLVEVEYAGEIIKITDQKDIDKISNIIVNSKYNQELCKGINTHKITIASEVYYLKEDCMEIQHGNKQAKLTKEDLETILNVIEKKK